MTSKSVEFEGAIFRLTTLEVEPGKNYEFVQRIGAVTVLPVTLVDGYPHVVAIHNNRRHYGLSSDSLPGGNLDGGFDEPEDPQAAGLRETEEEIGFTVSESSVVDTFAMRPYSSTVDYPRYFTIARGLIYSATEVDDPAEQIELAARPISDYVEPIMTGDAGHTYPEINLAFMRAVNAVGEREFIDWLATGESSYRGRIVQQFSPWLTEHTPA